MTIHPITLALRQMTDELREINVSKGFRVPEGGPGQNTFGDYIALLHSEVSEALEAYRSWKLEDATEPIYSRQLPKPEGVGSELADVLIRLIDTADVFGIDLAREYHRKVAYNRTRSYQHGGRTLSSDNA
jgi:NTP pyrophosphatase (non-canonical NTP hydrolase)